MTYRREFIKSAVSASTLLLLTACGGASPTPAAPAPTSGGAPKPTSPAAAAPTPTTAQAAATKPPG